MREHLVSLPTTVAQTGFAESAFPARLADWLGTVFILRDMFAVKSEQNQLSRADKVFLALLC